MTTNSIHDLPAEDIGVVLRDLADDLEKARIVARSDGEVQRAVGIGDALDMLRSRIAAHPRRSGAVPDAGQAPATLDAALALAARLTSRAEVIRPREDRDDLDQGNVDDIHEHGYHTGVADALTQGADEIRRLPGTDTTPEGLTAP